jgi:molecular chaperone DnaJ
VSAADPFEVLGLDPSCTDRDVGAAFRREAAKCHPDTERGRTDPRAPARFQAIAEARDLLLDPAARADAVRRRGAARTGEAFGDAFERFFDNVDRNGRGAAANAANRPRRGSDVDRTVALSLEQAFRGGSFVLRNAPGPCGPCGGTGDALADAPRTCPLCEGSGRSRQTKGLITVTVECPRCEGAGSTRTVPCPSCSGQGRNEGAGAPYQVPPGARDGMVVVLRGYGAPGYLGGTRGDIRLRLRIRPHDLYGRDGDDLRTRLRVPVWDVAHGCSRSLAGIDGLPVDVDVPAGSAGGDVLLVAGRGMPAFPGRGDLHVEILVEVPPADTPALRAAYDALREAALSAPAET